MKKKSISLIATALICTAALCGCGATGGGTSPAGASSSASEAGATVTSESFDVGSFTVAVPSGWSAITQEDMWAEEDKDGNNQVDPNSILLAKGTSEEWAALTGPNVRITYYSPDSYIIDARDYYDDVQELEGIKIGKTTCKGYSGNTLGYVYQFITYDTGDGTFEIQILTSTDQEPTGISYEDADVQAIMESLEVK